MNGRSWVSASVVIVGVGCAPDGRVPLSECEFGLYWAECGGNGEAVPGRVKIVVA
jgi:hypothetical protein